MRIKHAEFLDLWEKYLEYCKHFNSEAWFDAKRYTAGKYFSKWFNRPIEAITPLEVETHLIERKALSARSANLDLEILRHFFNWCVARDFLTKSPVRLARKFPLEKNIKPIPTQNDVRHLIENNKGENKLLILLLVFTMGRISEIRRLKWEDVNLSEKMLYLRTHKTKDGSEKIREIPIPGLLLDALAGCRQDSGYVLRSKDPNRPCRDLRKRLKRCFVDAGVPLQRGGFHQFRSYGISRLIEMGTDPAIVRDMAGHSSFNMTSYYTISQRKNKQEAMEKI